MKAVQNTMSNLKSNCRLPIKLLLLFLFIGSFGAQAQCPDSVATENIQWLNVSVDSIESTGCAQSCYTAINIYCAGNPSGDIVYAFEPQVECSNLPNLYYDENGEYICSYGGNSPSNCDSSFYENLIYIDNYWSCTDDSLSCEDFSVVITGSILDTICIGESLTLSADVMGGTATSFLWNNGATTATITVAPTPNNFNYIVWVNDANGCTAVDTFDVVAINCEPDSNSCETLAVTINGPNEPICFGDSVLLTTTVTGGNPGYTYDWGGPAIPPAGFPSSIAVSPTDISTYTVFVTDMAGCTASNFIVLSPDSCSTDTTDCSDFSVVITGIDSICIGQSLTLSADVMGGTAVTYLWNDGNTTATTTVNPTPNNFNYVVWANDANGCTAVDTFDIFVMNCIPDSNEVCIDSLNCVFPGDGNKSFAVNNYDVLNLGFGFNSTGPARNEISIAPEYFAATDWNSNGINNVNLKHADCNGDGVINATDVSAIDQNYNENASFNEMISGNNDEISLNINFETDTIIIGNNPLDSNIFVLEADLVLNQGIVKAALSGLAFQIDVDNIEGTLLDAYVTFDDDSWLTENNTPLTFSRFIASQNRIDVAVARTDQIPVAGSGKIGKVYMVIEDIIIGRVLNDNVNYSATAKNVVAVNDGTNSISVKGEKGEVVLSADIVAGTLEELQQSINIYPNPVRQQLYIQTNEVVDMIQLFNLEGQLMKVNEGQHTIDLSNLPNSQYIIKVITPKGVLTQRIIKID